MLRHVSVSTRGSVVSLPGATEWNEVVEWAAQAPQVRQRARSRLRPRSRPLDADPSLRSGFRQQAPGLAPLGLAPANQLKFDPDQIHQIPTAVLFIISHDLRALVDSRTRNPSIVLS